MPDRNDALQKHSSDMLALQKHILEALDGQLTSEDVKRLPEVKQLIHDVRVVVNGQVTELEEFMTSIGGEVESFLKNAVSTTGGVLAGIYDKMREHPVSRILRDDYTAMHLAAVAYGMLYTTALTYQESRLADLASTHLRSLTPLAKRIVEVLPPVVAREVQHEGGFAGRNGDLAAVETRRLLREAWCQAA